MKKIFLTTLSLILMILPALAQKEVNKSDLPALNLSGVWILDAQKSFLVKERREGYENYVLEIVHKETDIKINAEITFKGKEFNYAMVLFPDKRGEENTQVFEKTHFFGFGNERPNLEPLPIQLEEISLKTKTSLDKDKLLRRGIFTVSGVNHSLAEEYKLSKDGQTLTISSNFRALVAPDPRTKSMVENWSFRMIFRKKES